MLKNSDSYIWKMRIVCKLPNHIADGAMAVYKGSITLRASLSTFRTTALERAASAAEGQALPAARIAANIAKPPEPVLEPAIKTSSFNAIGCSRHE